MNREGSILCEMIIYVTLTAGLVLLFFNAVIAFSSVYLQQMSAVTKSISIHLASDLLYRDILQSSALQILSESGVSDIIVFRYAIHDVGWLRDEKKRLCRLTGRYEPRSQHWTSAQKTIVLPSLDIFTCSWHKAENNGLCIKYIIGHNSSSIEQTVYLHENRHA